MTKNIIEQVHAVFGDAIPGERHIFSATTGNLVTMTTVTKHFGSYEKFLKEYKIFCIEQRNAQAAKAVVTKPLESKGATKNEVK